MERWTDIELEETVVSRGIHSFTVIFFSHPSHMVWPQGRAFGSDSDMGRKQTTHSPGSVVVLLRHIRFSFRCCCCGWEVKQLISPSTCAVVVVVEEEGSPARRLLATNSS